MTACATETASVRRAGFTIAADGAYAACLARAGDAAPGDGWYPERWTLDGPEPYTVPLPGNQPEEPAAQVLPLPDGRVLILRPVADRHDLALLYPAGAGTGELPLGSLRGEEVRLLPPPSSGDALALAYDGHGSTGVWLVHGHGDTHGHADARGGGDAGTPRRLATVPGRCTGGVWLDRGGRLLALDRTDGGPVKAVAVDLERGEVSPLLQIAEGSNDRLLLAEPDSGLLLLRSDAPGEDRLGWGVLGSRRPVRFPEALRAEGTGMVLEPFAAQPGQILMPEATMVALRAHGPHGVSLVLWQPGERQASWLAGPRGWLAGSGLWPARGPLRLPYACAEWPCGVAEYAAPSPMPRPDPVPVPGPSRVSEPLLAPGPLLLSGPAPAAGPGPGGTRKVRRRLAAPRPLVIPLQQAPLT